MASKQVKYAAAGIGAVVIAIVVVLAVVLSSSSPHIAFPTTAQVDSATGYNNYTASSLVSENINSSAPYGAVKAVGEYFNNSAGSIAYIVIQFKSSALAGREFSNITNFSAKSSLSYRGASVRVVSLGVSALAIGHLGAYIFGVIFRSSSAFGNIQSTGKMTTLAELEVNSMLG